MKKIFILSLVVMFVLSSFVSAPALPDDEYGCGYRTGDGAFIDDNCASWGSNYFCGIGTCTRKTF